MFFSKLQKIFFSVVVLLITTYFTSNILTETNWILGDDALFWDHTAIGKAFPLSTFILPEVMRLFPFAQQDFNILLFFTETPSAFAHYIWISITFISFSTLFAYLLYLIERDSKFSYSLLLLPVFFFSIFSINPLIQVYMDVIYSERMILLLFTCFLILYYNALKTDILWRYILAFPFAVISTYYKEPVFGALIVIALFHFIFNYKTMTKNHKIFNLLLVVNALVYLFVFYITIYLPATGNYGSGRFSGGYEEAAKAIFYNKVLLAGAGFGIIRAFFVLFKKKQAKHAFFDATLYAGLAYAVAFVILKLVEPYYLLPALILIYPSFLYWTLKSYKCLKGFPILFTCAVAFIPFFYFNSQLDIIKRYHTYRITHMPQAEFLLNRYLEGYELIYIQQPITNPEHDFIGVRIRNHHKYILAQAFNLMLNQNNEVNDYFTIISELSSGDFTEKSIVLYPSENNLEQPMNAITRANLEAHFHSPELISYSILLYYPHSINYSEFKLNNFSTLAHGIDTTPVATALPAYEYANNLIYLNWYKHEEFWRWTLGNKSTILMKVDEYTEGITLSGSFFINPNATQAVSISINDQMLWQAEYTEGIIEVPITFTEEIIKQLQTNPLIVIDINLPDAVSPKAINLNGDARELGFALRELVTFGRTPVAISTLLPNQTIQIDGSQDESTIVLSNWSHQEPWGRWSEGSQATLTIKPDKTVQGVTLVGSYFTPENYVQNVKISVNNSFLFETSSNEGHEIRIEFPQEIQNTFNGNTYIDITLDFPNAVAPSAIIENAVDNRPLAFGLTGIRTF